MEDSTASPFALDLSMPAAAVRSSRKALHAQLKAAILDGRLRPGLQLPASRMLARDVGVSRNSVVAVYDLLMSEGLIVSRRGSGSFVAASPLKMAQPMEPLAVRSAGRLSPKWRDQAPVSMTRPALRLDLSVGMPDTGLFPDQIWRRLANRARRRTLGEARNDRNPYGLEILRQAIAGHVSLTRAVACEASDVLVTHGAQQAFDLLARVLVEPGRTVVAVEDPGYPPLRDALSAAGAILHPVAVDQEGIVVGDIPPEARVICVTPSHQFPLGAPMSPRRRLELLAFADAVDAVIVEDDYDGEFRFHDRPLDALQTLDKRQRVFYVGTFSKCMMNDLRLGFVVCPPWAMGALARAKQISDGYCSLAQQDALAHFISDGFLAQHLRRMRIVYARRRAVLLALLKARCAPYLQPFPSVAGLHIAATLHGQLTGEAVERAAAARGLRVRSIKEFASLETAPEGIVLGFGRADENTIASAIEVLEAVFRSWPSERLQYSQSRPA